VSKLKNQMTPQEAECYAAMQRWQRRFLKQRFQEHFNVPFFMKPLFHRGSFAGKLFIVLFNIILLPLVFLFWVFRILKAVFFLLPAMCFTREAPKNMRGPGERNLKGIHYHFASHVDLPIDMYIACVNEWTVSLYGCDKLPQFRFENYLDRDFLEKRKSLTETDPLIEQMLKTQISNAREELSRDLGYY